MNLLDLFTGSGIGSLAATAAGINVVAQCENDPCCLYCLERLWPHAKQYTDIASLTADALRHDGIGRIDIISGGFPCQDISTAGQGKGLEGERSGLWFEMRRIIDEVRPAWVLAENVPALRVRGGDRVLDDLEELGYACWPVVVGAEHVGAPHKRYRVWIVAHRPRDGQSTQRQTERANGLRTGAGGYEAMADAQRPRLGSGSGEPGDEGGAGCGRGELAGGVQLADTDQPGRTLNPCLGSDPREERKAIERNRWPARPGERQHEWEAPRLTQLGLADAANGLARRLRGRTNKALLRMAGNGWVYPIPEMIFRWIVEQENDAT